MESFLLAFKRKNNDYVPIDWGQSSLVQNINLLQPINICSLENIDFFTKNYTKEEIANHFFNEGLIDEDLRNKPLVIIFKNNNKYRELKQGVIFEEDKEVINLEFIYSTILNNLNDKEMLNWIYTYYKGKNKDTKYSDRLESFLIKIGEFSQLTVINIVNELGRFNELTYMEIRTLGFLLKRKILSKINKYTKEEPVSLKKEQ